MGEEWKKGEGYFNASLISISRLSTSVSSSDKSTPFCSALAEKYCHTLRSMEAGRKTLASGGMWCRRTIDRVRLPAVPPEPEVNIDDPMEKGRSVSGLRNSAPRL